MSITCIAATLLALLLLPAIVLLWATESREQRARRWRRDGWTQQRIHRALSPSSRSAQAVARSGAMHCSASVAEAKGM